VNLNPDKMAGKFNILLSGSKKTVVEHIEIHDFDFAEYMEYAEMLNGKCEAFWKADPFVKEECNG
jgi:hypothetical protein